MLTFLFWNLKSRNAGIVASLAGQHKVDVLILAECPMLPATVLTALNRPAADFFYAPGDCDKLQIYTRFSDEHVQAVRDGDTIIKGHDFSVRRLALPGRDALLLCAVHFPSKLRQHPIDQTSFAHRFAHVLARVENVIGHTRTVLVGDLNMNPYEDGVVTATGLHAVMTRRIALKEARRVKFESNLYFYNPMWSHFGEKKQGHAGTFFYPTPKARADFWNIYDQVLVRPALLPYFHDEDVAILWRPLTSRCLGPVQGVLKTARKIAATAFGTDPSISHKCEETSMPNQRAAFLDAIRAKPGDDTLRLIFADWLEEHGESARANFIRLQCQAERTPAWTSRRLDLQRQADELLLEHERDWLGDWCDRLVRWEFRRGFVHAATMTAKMFLRHGEDLFRAEPVYRLGLVLEEGQPLTAETVPAVVSHPAFRHVQSLDIFGTTSAWPSPWDCMQVPKWRVPVGMWLQCLAEAGHVTRLREFTRSGLITLYDRDGVSNGLEPWAVEAFCGAAHLRTLRVLNLNNCPLVGQSLDELVLAAPFAPRLRRLGLADCGLTDQSVNRLASNPTLARLRQLDLRYNPVSVSSLERVFNSSALESLDDVKILNVHLAALSRSTLARRLRGLTVEGYDGEAKLPTRREDWLRLIRAGGQPTRLHLIYLDPGREVLAAMGSEGWLRRLNTLTIENDQKLEEGMYRTGGIWRLLRSNAAPRLTRLRGHDFAYGNFIPNLAGWRGLARLEQLVLTFWHGSSHLAQELLGSPHLSGRLRCLHGVYISKDEDIDHIVGCDRLGGVRDLYLAFCKSVSVAAVERLFRSIVMSSLETLQLSFRSWHPGDLQELEQCVYQTLADPTVMPRLRHLEVRGWGNEKARHLLRARFGPRLDA
jgi:uncharacterized protein (TIGR02996 family)